MSELHLKFPPDFESKYLAYKAKILGQNISTLKKPVISSDQKFPHKLPRGTKWEDFIIKFLADDKILVKVRGESEELDYKAIGLEDRRNGKPDSQWAFLKVLAKFSGEISWSNQKAKDNYKKVVERLAEKLQIYFGIDYDPFHPYLESKSYKIKLTLIPLPDSENSPEVENGNISDEAEKMFSDLTDDY